MPGIGQGARLFVRRVSGRNEQHRSGRRCLADCAIDRWQRWMGLKLPPKVPDAWLLLNRSNSCLSWLTAGLVAGAAPGAESCGAYKITRLSQVNDFFVLLRSRDLLDIGSLEAFDAGQDREEIHQAFGAFLPSGGAGDRVTGFEWPR